MVTFYTKEHYVQSKTLNEKALDAARIEAYLKVAAELLSVEMLPKDRAELERSIRYWTLKASSIETLSKRSGR